MKEYAISILLVLVSFSTLTGADLVQANPSLNLTVRTDQQEYSRGTMVQVSGNLTLDGTLVTDGLVGIQIQDSENDTLIIRTLLTGNPPPETPYVYVQSVVPCDVAGNPQFSFHREELVYFNLSVVNLDIEPHNAFMTINTYYNNSTPFGYSILLRTIPEESFSTFRIWVPIPSDAVIGIATVYANAYTNWPEQGGTPYCCEKNSTFEIIESTFGAGQLAQSLPPTIQQTNEIGNYNTTFSLPSNSPYGNCTVYVTSRYLGEAIFNSTTFEVLILGDLGGGIPPQFFNFDGKVDGKDLTLFLQCFKGDAPPEAMYLGDLGGGVPPQFFAFDGVVDGKDLTLFLQCFKGQGP